MTNVLRIPRKFEKVELMSGMDFELDTMGLVCEICPRGGDVRLSLPGKRGTITLKENEKFTFTGKIYYQMISGAVALEIFYFTTL